MVLLDAIIIIFVLLMVARGIRHGFMRPLLSSIGFLSGLVIGSWLAMQLAGLSSDPMTKFIVVVAIELGLALALLVAGEFAGLYLDRWAWRHHLGPLDEVLAALLGVVFAITVVWLGASALGNVPAYGIGRQIKQSMMVRGVNAVLPTPPDILSRLEKVVSPNSFPNVFLGREPQHAQVSAFDSIGKEAVSRAAASVVKVQGRGCGRMNVGTGFVVAQDIVLTSAHVVAGMAGPEVLNDTGGRPATPIWFDRDRDVAVLHVEGLPNPPLTLVTAALPDSSASAILGFPGGGSLVSAESVIIDHLVATGRDIYNRGLVFRNIYEVQAEVEPGNSGGPLVAPDGSVAGIVFSESLTQDGVAYALLIEDARPLIYKAMESDTEVSTEGCTSP